RERRPPHPPRPHHRGPPRRERPPPPRDPAVRLASLLALALAGCAEPGVTRIVDGRPTEGRFISGAAYAYFARGASAEAAGELIPAIRGFTAASVEDPE